MIREFVELVNESVEDGYNRGIKMFMENLEVDLAKSEIVQEQTNGIDGVIKQMFISEGYELLDEDLDNIDDDKLDAALKAMEEEE